MEKYKNNEKAIIYFILGALFFSFIPLFSKIGLATNLSSISLTFLSFFVAALFGLGVVSRVFDVQNIFQEIKEKNIFITLLIRSFAKVISLLSFITSLYFINPVITAVVFELSKIITVLLSSILLKDLYSREIKKKDVFLGLFSLIGVWVILTNGEMSIFAPYNSNMLIGFFLALISALFDSITAISGTKVTHMLTRKFSLNNATKLSTFFTYFLGTLFLIPLVIYNGDLGANFLLNKITFVQIFLITIYGILCNYLPTMFYQKGIQIAESPKINILWYIAPIFAVFWLYIFGYGSITAFTLIGISYIFVSNLLLNFNLDENLAYYISIIAILIFGTILLMTNGVENQNYFEAITAPLIFFAIIIAYLLDRLVKQHENEEFLVFEIIEQINKSHSLQKNLAINELLAINIQNSKDLLNKKYNSLLQLIGNEIDNKFINRLIVSKTNTLSIGEVFILLLTGMLSIFVSILYRPSGFLYEIFAIVITTSIIFTIATVFDTNNFKKRVYLTYNEQEDDFRVSNIFFTEDSLTEKIIGIFILIITVFIISLAFILKYQ